MSFNVIIPFVEQQIKTLKRTKNSNKKRFYVGKILDMGDFTKNNRPYLPQTTSLPAIYLFPEKNTANDNMSIGYHLQKVVFTIGVMIVEQTPNNVRLYGDSTNFSQASSSEQLVKDALMGATPSHQYTPLNLESSSFYSHKENLTFWKQSYTTSFFHLTSRYAISQQGSGS